MDLKERLQLSKECVGIINQLFDLAEVPVKKRQEINDQADKYLLDQVLRLLNSSLHVKEKQKTGLEKYIEDYFIENSNKYYDKQNAKEYSFKQVIAEYKENQLNL